MARRKSRTLTEVELEFMQIIWSKGEATTDDLLRALEKRGRRLADGSVRKILSILVEKGHATRKQKGRGFLYKAKLPAGRANRNMIMDLLNRAFGGSAALMVAALLDTRAVRRKDIDEIKKLIAEREGEERK